MKKKIWVPTRTLLKRGAKIHALEQHTPDRKRYYKLIRIKQWTQDKRCAAGIGIITDVYAAAVFLFNSAHIILCPAFNAELLHQLSCSHGAFFNFNTKHGNRYKITEE